MCSESIRKKNALICALYMWQFSFLTPIMFFINSTVITSFFSLILLITTVMINSRKLSFYKNLIYFFIGIVTILLTKVMMYPSSMNCVIDRIISFISIGLLSLFIGGLEFDIKRLEIYCNKLMWISFVCIFWMPIKSVLISQLGYMRFGYAMLPIANTLLFRLFIRTRYIFMYLLIYIFALVEMFIWGARGCIIAHIVFLLLVIIENKSVVNRGVKICVVAIGIGIIYNYKGIIYSVKEMMDAFGIQAYSINKFLMQIENGFEIASSGRNYLWECALAVIRENPIFGNRLDYVQIYGNNLYFHNLFLEMGADFGVVVLLLFIIWLITVLHNNLKSCKSIYIFSLLFSTGIGRLFVSSTIWQRPEFWLFIAFIFSKKFVVTNFVPYDRLRRKGYDT